MDAITETGQHTGVGSGVSEDVLQVGCGEIEARSLHHRDGPGIWGIQKRHPEKHAGEVGRITAKGRKEVPRRTWIS